jgi:D-glycero-alpha-D-manno-heptose-7-phosphate kinase
VIVTRTPFRITLGGGGTDLPSFYKKHGGRVLALGIDKYMYVALNVPFADRKVRLHYTSSETVERTSELRHELAREALVLHEIHDGVEVSSLADLPAGTGLGSSSCYLVGLLAAIRAYLGRPATVAELASEACRIELDILGKPIGKQDQFMAAAGGLTEIVIDRDGTVGVERIGLPGYAVSELVSKTHLYYTNVSRVTTEILADETRALDSGTGDVEGALCEILEIGARIGVEVRRQNFDAFGTLMHEHWLAKKRLSGRVTVPAMEELYDAVRARFGVLGGKVAGAGGGGFLMLYCPSDGHALTEFMAERGMARLTYDAEFEGSRVLLNALGGRSLHYHLARGPLTASPPA